MKKPPENRNIPKLFQLEPAILEEGIKLHRPCSITSSSYLCHCRFFPHFPPNISRGNLSGRSGHLLLGPAFPITFSPMLPSTTGTAAARRTSQMPSRGRLMLFTNQLLQPAACSQIALGKGELLEIKPVCIQLSWQTARRAYRPGVKCSCNKAQAPHGSLGNPAFLTCSFLPNHVSTH